MKAQSLIKKLYKGDQLEPKCEVTGFKPKKSDGEMICDCDGGGECCSE
jgi:hypothetical protein